MRKKLLFVIISGLLVSVWAQSPAQGNIRLKGPETLILFGQKVSQLYEHRQPGVTIRTEGGSVQVALTELLKGQIDIAQSHGEIRSEITRGLVSVPVGVEAIVLYVHESNPINELSVAQVRAIYTGEITNWKQLGGHDQTIVLYGGESTASLNPYFAEFILQGDTSFSYHGKPSTKELLDAVASNPDAIGFAAFGYAPHVKQVRIRSGSHSIEPTIAAIRSLDYPIARYIYWYMAHEPRGALKDLTEWMFSPEGQMLVEAVGFQPLLPEKRMAARQRLGLPAITSPMSGAGH